MMLSTMLILLLWLFLLEGAVSLQASTPSAESDTLASLFKPEYSEYAAKLSPSRIVSVMPTGAAASSKSAPNTGQPLRQELFTSPVISTLYERVLPPLWAMGLRIGGPDAEYQSAAPHLLGGDAAAGRIALDLSCGTGFIGRRIAASKQFRHVFALDYSPQMLTECIRSILRENEEILPISILRGDAQCLPFQDNAIDAIHWGAAMHCVPDVEKALSEVYRVLKPGGKLYATTFLRPFPDIIFRFFTVDELERLSCDAGFDSAKVQVEGRGVYVIIRATK